MSGSLRVSKDAERAFALTELRTFRSRAGLPYAMVSHNPEFGLVSDLWLGGFDEQDDFRAVLNFLAETFEGGGYRYWLADLRYMSTEFTLSGDWLVDELMPRVFNAGLVREALVVTGDSGVPEGYDVFGSASTALPRLSDGRIRGFPDIEASKAWLFDGLLPNPD